MGDFVGVGLIVLGCGLLASGVMKRRARMRPNSSSRAIRPEFAAMGEAIRHLVLLAVGFVGLKMMVFYFVFGGDRLLPPLAFGGMLFVLAAYAAWLVMVTSGAAVSGSRPVAPDHAPSRQPAAAE